MNYLPQFVKDFYHNALLCDATDDLNFNKYISNLYLSINVSEILKLKKFKNLKLGDLMNINEEDQSLELIQVI